MVNISAIIVVKGNPTHVKETISSVEGFVTEILIADIGIDQELLAVLKKHKLIRILKIEKDVPYVELIREDLKKRQQTNLFSFLIPMNILLLNLLIF